jgi:hypothetical protein
VDIHVPWMVSEQTLQEHQAIQAYGVGVPALDADTAVEVKNARVQLIGRLNEVIANIRNLSEDEVFIMVAAFNLDERTFDGLSDLTAIGVIEAYRQPGSPFQKFAHDLSDLSMAVKEIKAEMSSLIGTDKQARKSRMKELHSLLDRQNKNIKKIEQARQECDRKITASIFRSIAEKALPGAILDSLHELTVASREDNSPRFVRPKIRLLGRGGKHLLWKVTSGEFIHRFAVRKGDGFCIVEPVGPTLGKLLENLPSVQPHLVKPVTGEDLEALRVVQDIIKKHGIDELLPFGIWRNNKSYWESLNTSGTGQIPSRLIIVSGAVMAEWVDKKGNLHREDGPARILYCEDGSLKEEFWRNGRATDQNESSFGDVVYGYGCINRDTSVPVTDTENLLISKLDQIIAECIHPTTKVLRKKVRKGLAHDQKVAFYLGNDGGGISIKDASGNVIGSGLNVTMALSTIVRRVAAHFGVRRKEFVTVGDDGEVGPLYKISSQTAQSVHSPLHRFSGTMPTSAVYIATNKDGLAAPNREVLKLMQAAMSNANEHDELMTFRR